MCFPQLAILYPVVCSFCACVYLCEQIRRNNGKWEWAEYSTFSISSGARKYKLKVSGHSGNAVDSLRKAGSFSANNMKFSTPDQDNDECPCKCAVKRESGWWFNWCSAGYLNRDGLTVWSTNGQGFNVKMTRMLLKFKQA